MLIARLASPYVFRFGRFVRGCAGGLLILGAMSALLSTSARASGPTGGGSGWQRGLVAMRDGAPNYIRAIVQTPDGFIWLGAISGLYRYDGRSFDRIASSDRRPLQSDAVDSLLAMPNGDVWVGHDWGGLSLVRGGRHTVVPVPGLSTVTQLRLGPKGIAWAVSLHNEKVTLVRLIANRWRTWADSPGRGYISDAIVAGDGRLWYLQSGHLFSAASRTRSVSEVSRATYEDASLAVDGRGRAWLLAGARVYPLQSPREPGLGPGRRRSSIPPGGATTPDGPNAFWVAEGGKVLKRFEVDPASGAMASTYIWQSNYWLPDSGLNGHDLAMLVDREGTLLVGTSKGLEVFTRSAFKTVLTAGSGAGQAPTPYAISDGRGDVWIKAGAQLFKVDADGRPQRQNVTLPPAFTLCGSRGGGVWIPDGSGRLIVFGSDTRRSVPFGKPSLVGLQCAEDGAGRVWTGGGSGLSLLSSGGTQRMPLGPDENAAILGLIPDGRRQVLAYVGRGSLWRSDGSSTRIIWRENAIDLGLVETMFSGPQYALVGGDRGLSRIRNGRVKTILRDREPQFDLITGIVQTPAGETWLQSARGLVRMRTADLDRSFDDPAFPLRTRLYGLADGLPGTEAYLNLSSVTADRFGRIWIMTNGGVARYERSQDVSGLARPRAVITAVEADGRHLDVGDPTVLPPGTARLQVNFTAPTSMDPSRLRFRYRLVGVDPDWVVVGRERMAVYTNLAPGAYRLQILVATDAGGWAKDPTSIDIVLRPLIYQTRWFAAVCVLLFLITAVLAYRWRLSTLSRRLRNSAAERANERERIAREIHDTLLQSVQGLVLRFQSVASGMHPEDRHRSRLEETLDRADRLIAQGKDRIRGLRDDDQPMEMTALIKRTLDEAPFRLDVAKSFSWRGRRQPVNPAVAFEAREIVSEALFNAARHAQAEHVYVELVFGARRLDIKVSDDGVGIPQAQTGVPHPTGFGLLAMQGRADQIGATLSISPRAPHGTAVALSIRARRAYVRHRPGSSGQPIEIDGA